MTNSGKNSLRLVIDPLALWQIWKKKGEYYFFTSGSLTALIDFYRRGYRFFLLNNHSDKNLTEAINLGKKILLGEGIRFSTISPKTFPIDEKPCLYALSPASYLIDSLIKIDKRKGLIFLKTPFERKSSSTLPVRDWSRFSQMILHPVRAAAIKRKTSETEIAIALNLDGSGKIKVKTGLGFFDHMLTNFSKHSGIDLVLSVKGDLQVDEHHTIEDTALALGEAFKQALGDKRGLERYGFVLPMDESEAACSLDFSGRSHLEWNVKSFRREYVGDFPTEMLKHFYNSFCLAAGLNMNMKITGENEHHLIESSFKSFARSIRQALKVTGQDIPSTKGSL